MRVLARVACTKVSVVLRCAALQDRLVPQQFAVPVGETSSCIVRAEDLPEEPRLAYIPRPVGTVYIQSQETAQPGKRPAAYHYVKRIPSPRKEHTKTRTCDLSSLGIWPAVHRHGAEQHTPRRFLITARSALYELRALSYLLSSSLFVNRLARMIIHAPHASPQSQTLDSP
jgi:hypothetical protein